MKFFKKPVIAIILAVIIIFSSSSISIIMGLNKKLDTIEEVFYYGSSADGRQEKGIHSQLLELCRVTEGLIILADNLELDDHGLVDARTALEYELKYDDIYIEWIYDAYMDLWMSIKSFEKNLSETEYSEVAGLFSAAEQIKQNIESSTYNDFRTDYIKNLGWLEKFFIYFYDLDVPDYFI